MAVKLRSHLNWLMNMLRAFSRKVGELSPNCREAARLQSEALDHPLGLGQRVGLRLHLVLCKWCRRYGTQLRFLRSAAQRGIDHEHTSQSLPPGARERIKRRLRDEET
jgi:hypothetical protein